MSKDDSRALMHDEKRTQSDTNKQAAMSIVPDADLFAHSARVKGKVVIITGILLLSNYK